MLTFDQWRATRRWSEDLSLTSHDWPVSARGYTYEPLGVIEQHAPALFVVLIYNTEREFLSLASAERYLWQEFARDEINDDFAAEQMC